MDVTMLMRAVCCLPAPRVRAPPCTGRMLHASYWMRCAVAARSSPAMADLMNTGRKKLSRLAIEFMHQCNTFNGIHFHAPLVFDVQEFGVRGVYLAKGSIPRHSVILTVPYSGVLTMGTSSTLFDDMTPLVGGGEAPPKITLPQIQSALQGSEFAVLSVQIFFAIQLAMQTDKMMHSIGVMDRLGDDASQEDVDRVSKMLTSGIYPWCRMLDQEPWSDAQNLSNYKSALDTWQLTEFNDMNTKFGRQMTSLHHALKLQVPLESFTRLTRVIVARTDHIPVASGFGYSKPMRWLRGAYRAMKKLPDVEREIAVVPFVDMLNHSNQANTAVRFAWSDEMKQPVVKLIALRPIHGGDELCRHYNFEMDRASALFRYGFLPFQLFQVERLDPWKEHYAKYAPGNLKPEPDHVVKERKRVDAEVERLQRIFHGNKEQ